MPLPAAFATAAHHRTIVYGPRRVIFETGSKFLRHFLIAAAACEPRSRPAVVGVSIRYNLPIVSIGSFGPAGARANLALLLEWVSPRRRLLREIRETWAQPGAKDGGLADRYFRLAKADNDSSHVDDRTWNDLEFPRIFTDLDTTITPLGSQYLFRLLRTDTRDSVQTKHLHESVRTLRRDQGLREQIQLILASLNSVPAAMIVDSLFQDRLEGPTHPRLTLAWSIACIALLVSMAASVVSLTFVIPLVVVNMVIVARTGLREYERKNALETMQRMLGVADKISRKYAGQPLPHLAALAGDAAARKQARRALRLIGVIERLPLGAGTWLNLLCLAKRLSHIYTANRVPRVLPALLSTYELVGSLDAAIAVASLLERTGTWCRPVIGPEPGIEIEAGYHPLLDRPVPNSLLLSERSALISGSNMAGKTTFIKMIGINVVLGRTLGICLAARATIPCSPVMACIRSQESVEPARAAISRRSRPYCPSCAAAHTLPSY